MKHPLRSSVTFEGRRMAGARALWRAAGMQADQVGKPVIAVVNSFTQFVPGHTHLQLLFKCLIEFSCEAIWSWAFVFWKIFDYSFNFSACNWVVHNF